MSAFSFCNKPPTTILYSCVWKPSAQPVLYVGTSEEQMYITSRTPRCYVPHVLVSSQLNVFIFLCVRKVAVHTEIHLWPTRISNSWRYARCPLPVAAPYPTYTCKPLTDAQLFSMVGLSAARHQRRVAVKVRVGCRCAHGTFCRRLREDYKSECVRVLPHLFAC